MLRLALLVLLVANAGYLAWSQGWMASLGWQPDNPAETFRLQQQVRPDALLVQTAPPPAASAAPAAPVVALTSAPATVVAEGPAPAAPAPAPVEATQCWQVGSFDEAHTKLLREALQQQELPAHSWQLVASPVPGRWMVYIGKLNSPAALEQRRAELRKRDIEFDRAGGALDPGLSLGRFASEEAATRELTQVLRKGVRGARVVQERPASTVYTLQLAQATAALQTRLQVLQPLLGNKTWKRCDSPTP